MRTSEKAQPRREVWRDVIRRQASSGESVRGFCREQGINLNTFYKWKNKLGGTEVSNGNAARFALVELNGAEAKSGMGMELIFVSGERLVIGAGVDVVRLRTVLAVLRERA